MTVTSVGVSDFSPKADSVAFQWLRNGSSISGATGSTYVPVAGDVGQSITVKATGSKVGYTSASKTSAAVVVGAATFATVPTPVVSGTAEVGNTLTATKAGVSDFSPKADSVAYQWLRGGVAIFGATGATYAVSPDDVGKSISVRVTGTKAGYDPGAATSLAVTGQLGSFATTAIPQISGTPKVGNTLTATKAGVSDFSPKADSVSYQWYRAGSAISGATGSTCKLTSADEGKSVTVKVTGKLAGYADGVGTSSAVTVGKGTFATVPAPVITGDAKVGSTLTATKAMASDFVPAADSVSYQWLRGDEPILGAAAATYVVSPDDVGKAITVRVTGTKAGYAPGSQVSEPVTGQLGVFSSLATPKIGGEPVVGNFLELTGATPSDFAPTADSVSYQWLRDGDPIPGATELTYKVTENDGGTQISVRVTGSKAGYEPGLAASRPVSVPGLAFASVPTPVVERELTVGNTLMASGAGASDFDPAADKVTYQWLRGDEPIPGATGDRYELVAADEGTQISVRATGTKVGYEPSSEVSDPVDVPVSGPNKPLVSRLAGSSRYGTNDAVNARFGVKGGPVFVATGADFADALSIGPVVGITGGTLFLVPGKSVDQKTLNAMKALSPSAVYVIGGRGAVSDAVVSKVKAATGRTPVRVAGKNRYDTSEQIYKKFFVEQNRPVASAFVATGRDFPDALSAASAGSALKAPVLLVDGKTASSLSSYLVSSLKAKKTSWVLISGGKGAVSSTIQTNLGRSFTVERLSGANRYATNAAVIKYVDSQAGSTALSSVFVATGADFPDALSAAAPSGKLSSRLVLSNGSCIPKPVVSEWITKPGSKVTDVYLVGGKGVLKQSVFNLNQCQ